MPEGNINAEVVEHLREHGEHEDHDGHTPSKRRIEVVEILEAIILAIVALATAVSGYQAALFDGESAKEYATASRLRVAASNTSLTANQYLAYNASTTTAWVEAMQAGNTELADILSRRLLPYFRPAFDAWVKTDPLNNPDAPAGPSEMPEFTNPLAEKAAEINGVASHAFDQGVDTRLTAEKYVRVTVILAASLFLIAIGQRFKIRGVRWGVNTVAGVLLVYCVALIAVYPHIYTH
jgi:hypothetical protein